MTRVYYEIGHEHADGLLAVQTLDVLPEVTGLLPLGAYWIDRVTVHEAWDPEEGWVYRRLYEPHGRLDVTGPGHWHFAALAGAELGPGYVIV